MALPTALDALCGGMLDATVTKRCSGCGSVKPCTEFYRRKGGMLLSECKSCLAGRAREWNAQNRPTANRRQQRWRERNGPRASFLGSVAQALKRHPSHDPITVQYLLEMLAAQDGKCALSGLVMTFGGGLSPTSCSIDRLDQGSPYDKGNVRLVCHAINAFRGRMADEEFWSMVAALAGKMPR